MQVRIISTPITPFGSFNRGDVLSSPRYPESFLVHLVEAAGAAEYIDAKVTNPVAENKTAPVKKKRGRPPKQPAS